MRMKQHGSWHEVISSAQSNTFISAKNAHWTCLYWRITHLHRSSARTILEQQHSVATVFRQLHRGEWCKGFVWRLLAPKFCTCCLFSWKSSWIKLPPIMAFCATKSGQLPGQICTNTLVNSPLKTHKRFFPLHKFPQVSTYWIFLAIFWSKLIQGCVGLLQTVQTHQADSKGRKFETFWHNPKFNNTWAMIKNPCDIPLHKLICKDFGPHSGFGHCSLNNKSIHWFNQPPNWKYSEPSFVKSCSRRTDGTTVRHTNHPHKTKQPTQKPPPEQKTHNQETCTCITWETLLWREALNFLKAIPSKLEDGANILWRRGDEPFNFHRVSFFVIWCVGDHSYGIYCCMICVLLCTPCRIQKKKCRYSTAMSMSNKLYKDGFHNSFPLNLRFRWGLLRIALMIHNDTYVYFYKYMCVFTYSSMYLSTSPISWNFWTFSVFTCWPEEKAHTIIIFIHPHCKQ